MVIGTPYSRRSAVGALASMLMFTRAALAKSQEPSKPSAPPIRQFRIIADDPSFARLVSPDATLDIITTFPRLRGEAPIWHRGKLWLAELREGQVIEVALDGTRRIVAESAGGRINPAVPTLQGPNGLANWKNGAVLVCRQAARDIGILKPDGTMRSLVGTYQGKRFNSPNDVVVRSDDSIWFTDPPLALPGHPWARPADPDAPPPATPPVLDKQIPFNGVFRFKDGKVTAVITDMPAPNGLAFSPDERTLYVNNAMPEMTVRSYPVHRNGSLGAGREIFRLPADTPQGIGVPDGLKVDIEGNIWMSGPGGLYVLSPDGKLLGRILLPSRSTNMCFGDDNKSLFVVSNPNVLRIRTRVAGGITPYSK